MPEYWIHLNTGFKLEVAWFAFLNLNFLFCIHTIIWIPKKPKFDIRQSKISGFQRNAIRKPLKFRKRLFVSWLDIIVMELSIKQFWRSLLEEAISHDRILVRIWPKIFTMTNINNWTLPKIYLQHMLAHALHEIRPRLVRTYLR